MTDLGDVHEDTGPFLGWPEGNGDGAGLSIDAARPADTAAPPAPDALPDGLAPLVALLASRVVDPETAREMLAMQREYRRERAREAFAAALARFRVIAPTLDKDREVIVEEEDGRGGTTSYRHTSLGHAMERVNPLLGELDLNLSWHPRVEDGVVHVETRLTHALGHAESVTLPGAPDASGGKNAIQAMKSTITYLERTGALALLGLAARDDDDGRAACPPPALVPSGGHPIDEVQAEALSTLLDRIERLDPGARRRWYTHYAGLFEPADNALGLAVPARLHDRAERQLVDRLAERQDERRRERAGGRPDGRRGERHAEQRRDGVRSDGA